MRKGAKIAIWVVGAIVVIGGIGDLTGANKTPQAQNAVKQAVKHVSKVAQYRAEVASYLTNLHTIDSAPVQDLSIVQQDINNNDANSLKDDLTIMQQDCKQATNDLGDIAGYPTDLPTKAQSLCSRLLAGTKIAVKDELAVAEAMQSGNQTATVSALKAISSDFSSNTHVINQIKNAL